MRCTSCHNINLDPTTTCTHCGANLPAPGYIAAITRAEQLIRRARYDEAGAELIKAEAELKLARLDEDNQRIATVRLLVSRGRVLFFKAQYRPADDLVRQAVAQLDDSPQLALLRANAFNILTNIALYSENAEQAERYAVRALYEAKQAGDPFMLGTILNSRANVALHQGEDELAMDMYKQALPYAEEAGSLSLAGAICGNLANLYQQHAEIRTSLEYALRGLSLSEQAGDQLRLGFMLVTLGVIYITLGELEAATSHLERAYRLALQLDNPSASSHAYINLAELNWLKGAAAAGYELATAALVQAGEDYREQLVAYAIQVHCALAMSELDKAAQAYRNITDALKLHNAPIYNENYYLVLSAGPALHAAQHEWTEAQAGFEQALIRADAHSDAHSRAQLRLIYAEALLTNVTNAAGRASQLLAEARELFTLLGATRHVQHVQSLQDTIAMMAEQR